MSTHHQIIVIGGGNAGISMAAQLLNKNKSLDIAIVEPSDKLYYQPALHPSMALLEQDSYGKDVSLHLNQYNPV